MNPYILESYVQTHIFRSSWPFHFKPKHQPTSNLESQSRLALTLDTLYKVPKEDHLHSAPQKDK